jgi:AcrR family transcriptional regulator
MSVVPTRKRGPYQRSRERREQIAAAVLDLVDEVGHEGVTTALVAARSGSPEATVLYHYPTKDHLLVAALERSDDLQLELAGIDARSTTLDPEELRAVADFGIRFGDRRLRLYIMLKGQAATSGHPAVDYISQRTERTLAVFAGLITARQRAGMAHPGLDPRDTARQIIALWDGLTFMRVGDRDFDIGTALVDGVRRLTGENWMQALATMNQPTAGL